MSPARSPPPSSSPWRSATRVRRGGSYAAPGGGARSGWWSDRRVEPGGLFEGVHRALGATEAQARTLRRALRDVPPRDFAASFRQGFRPDAVARGIVGDMAQGALRQFAIDNCVGDPRIEMWGGYVAAEAARDAIRDHVVAPAA